MWLCVSVLRLFHVLLCCIAILKAPAQPILVYCRKRSGHAHTCTGRDDRTQENRYALSSECRQAVNPTVVPRLPRRAAVIATAVAASTGA